MRRGVHPPSGLGNHGFVPRVAVVGRRIRHHEYRFGVRAGHRGIAAGGEIDIDGGIGRKTALVKQFVKLARIVGREKDGVMRASLEASLHGP
jgi:hypothetical protein